MMDYIMTFTFVMGLVLGIVFLNIPPALDTLMMLYSVSYKAGVRFEPQE